MIQDYIDGLKLQNYFDEEKENFIWNKTKKIALKEIIENE